MKEVISIRNFNLFYGPKQALFNINLPIYKQQVTALIGPSGCGKSSLLRSLNRMNDFVLDARVEGEVLLNEKNIYHPNIDPVLLRTHVGMVFQKPNPFPMSIYENVAYGLRIQGEKNEDTLHKRVEWALKQAALYEEVQDRLEQSALDLSGGQQQRLCIARAIALKPTVLLMDEPTSALDPVATNKIEDLIRELRKDYTIVIVTHSMQQAARVSDHTAFLLDGKLIEYSPSERLFHTPDHPLTEKYITGRFD